MKLIFTDINGKKYYRDNRGDIVRKDGSLVTLTEEYNINAILLQQPAEQPTKPAPRTTIPTFAPNQ